MTLADTPFISPIQRAHSGGFFWTVNRSRRIQAILEVASRVQKLVIIAGSESEATDVSERLTLRGLPVQLAAAPNTHVGRRSFDSGATTALVTTAEYVQKNGPVNAPLTIHLRPPISVRSYVKRLKSSVSAVHVTFVTPEDQQRAGALRSVLSPDLDPSGDEGIELSSVLDLTASPKAATVEAGRRRFAFRGELS